VAARLPAGWHLHPADPAVPASVDLVADGPSGAQLVVMHFPLPPGAQVDADSAAERLANGMTSMGVQVEPNTTRVDDYPMGRSVRVSAKAQGHAAEVVVVPKGDVLWEVVLASGGSSRATHDFDGILKGIQLPSAGVAE
jgi:hypothetical protein